MTSDKSQNGSPPGRSVRRVDEGDLWADSASEQTPSETTATSPRPRSKPQTPARAAAPVAASAPSAARTARQTGDQGAVARDTAPAAPPPPYNYDDYEDEYDGYYDDREPSLLGNPYVLAAIAVAAAVLLAVIVVVMFGRGDGGGQTPGTVANASPTATPALGGSTGPAVTGLLARSIAIATVREGPALGHLELGLLQAAQDVDVVGRNEEATWFQIVFPQGTQLRGWVPSSALRLPDNVSALVPLAEVTQVPRPEVPDPTATPEPEETPTPAANGADLAISIVSNCTPGTPIAVMIINAGTRELTEAPIEVIVANDGNVLYQQAFQADMAAGAGARLETGIPAMAPNMSVTVLLTEEEDSDTSNNTATCSVQGGGGGGNLPPPIATQGN